MSDHSRHDVVQSYKSLRQELVSFNDRFNSFPEILVLTKMDLPEIKELSEEVANHLKEEIGCHVHCISAATGFGIQELLRDIARHV